LRLSKLLKVFIHRSTGERCEIDIKECESDPCENGGTCDDTIAKNEYSCQCPPMWEGVNCEEGTYF